MKKAILLVIFLLVLCGCSNSESKSQKTILICDVGQNDKAIATCEDDAIVSLKYIFKYKYETNYDARNQKTSFENDKNIDWCSIEDDVYLVCQQDMTNVERLASTCSEMEEKLETNNKCYYEQ